MNNYVDRGAGTGKTKDECAQQAKEKRIKVKFETEKLESGTYRAVFNVNSSKGGTAQSDH